MPPCEQELLSGLLVYSHEKSTFTYSYTVVWLLFAGKKEIPC
jgi:hypothetical protein